MCDELVEGSLPGTRARTHLLEVQGAVRATLLSDDGQAANHMHFLQNLNALVEITVDAAELSVFYDPTGRFSVKLQFFLP